MWQAAIAVAVGSATGGLLRWFLSLQLNSMLPTLPPGTLVSNLVGGYIVGLAIAYFAWAPGIPGHWRLLVITGFCGGLTTFSTFSAEIVMLLQQGRAAMAALAVVAHLGGSLLMTAAGMASWSWLQPRG